MAWGKGFTLDRLPALGFLELSSISRGLYLTDRLIKKAPIKMITSQPISSGKHVVLYFGDVASVEEAHQEAKNFSDGVLLNEVFIPSVHPQLVPFLESLWKKESFVSSIQDSVAIVESNTLTGAILSADRALKAADVKLCRMRLGHGIGGKAYFVICGEQEDVEASVEAAKEKLDELKSYCRSDLIANPFAESLNYF